MCAIAASGERPSRIGSTRATDVPRPSSLRPQLHEPVRDEEHPAEPRPYHLAQLRGAAVATVVLAVLCGVVFPAAVWAIAQLFPENAHGSLVFSDGTPRGSRLIGQTFRSARYFHGRPSAAGVRHTVHTNSTPTKGLTTSTSKRTGASATVAANTATR